MKPSMPSTTMQWMCPARCHSSEGPTQKFGSRHSNHSRPSPSPENPKVPNPWQTEGQPPPCQRLEWLRWPTVEWRPTAMMCKQSATNPPEHQKLSSQPFSGPAQSTHPQTHPLVCIHSGVASAICLSVGGLLVDFHSCEA